MRIVGSQQRLERGEGTLQIIQLSAGDELFLRSPDAWFHAIDQEQILSTDIADLTAERLCDQCVKITIFTCAGREQRQHVHLLVERHAVVDIPLHMDRHIRDEHQITVEVDQPGHQPVAFLYQHTAGDRKRTIHPRCTDHAAVSFRVQLHIAASSLQLCLLLDLEGR